MAKLGRYSADRKKVKELTAAHTVSVAECGTMFMLNSADGFVVTLPTAAEAGSGWWCHFIVSGDAGSNDYSIVTSGSENTIVGLSFFNKTSTDGSSDGDVATASDEILFDGSGDMNLGDKAEVYCDGSKFYVYCFAVDVAAVILD